MGTINLLVVGGPCDGQRLEMSETISRLIIPVPEGGRRFGEFVYRRRCVKEFFCLAPDDWTDAQILASISVDAQMDRLN